MTGAWARDNPSEGSSAGIYRLEIGVEVPIWPESTIPFADREQSGVARLIFRSMSFILQPFISPETTAVLPALRERHRPKHR